MRALEKQGRLDRAVEFLPGSAAMRARGLGKQYLTRPELSRPAGLRQDRPQRRLLDSDLPDDPLLEGELLRYFPTTLQEPFGQQIRGHRLRREIATLQVVNSLVNPLRPDLRAPRSASGPAHPPRRSPAPSPVVRDAWKLRDLWTEIEALDTTLKAGHRPACWSPRSASCCAPCNGRCAACPSRSTPWPRPPSSGTAVAALGDLPVTLIA
jgi:glutamate dehydrogenase